MQAAISRMAAASAPMGEAAWQTAAFPAAITGDPWELEGALSALADVFAQLFPVLSFPGDNLGRGIAQLDKILPAIGDAFVDPGDPQKFSSQPAHRAFPGTPAQTDRHRPARSHRNHLGARSSLPAGLRPSCRYTLSSNSSVVIHLHALTICVCP